jgi:glycosyltransferase involved in cell wall biosynthesis
MKIAMIDPSLFTWPYDKALVDALRAQGHKVDFYTKHLAAGEQGKDGGGVIELFYPGLQSPIAKKLPQKAFLGIKGILHIFSMIALWIVLFLKKPDLIHFQWVPLPVVDRFFIPLFQKIAPVVLTVHDSSPFNNNPRAKLQAVGATDIMRQFDHLIVHTEKAQSVVHTYGIGLDKISRIAHGVLGVDKIATPVSTDRTKSGDKVVALLFGHLKPYKGADLLVESLAKMSPESRTKICLRIVGKPQMDVAPLKERAVALGVQANIEWDLRFIGDDEIEQVFASSDITVMPYREIDASGVLMVALSIGKPIVATNIGLFKELLTDGVHGFLIAQESTDELALALEKLVLSDGLRAQMGANVIALGQSIPTWNDIAQTTTQMYKKVSAR